jgi:hypothetical protein
MISDLARMLARAADHVLDLKLQEQEEEAYNDRAPYGHKRPTAPQTFDTLKNMG